MKKSLLIISTIFFMFSTLISETVLGIGTIDTDNGTLEILINTDSDFVGFQLDVYGVDGIDLIGGNGGLAEEYGFSVYADGNTALGFSLNQTVIPAGSNGILTILEGTINAHVCLPFLQGDSPETDTPILSDLEGLPIDISVDSSMCDPLSIEEEITFSLLKTYPNPFNPELNIDVAIENSGQLDVSIYNVNGQHIQTIYNDAAVAHNVYNLKWNASAMSSGIYIVQVDTPTGKYSNIVNLLK